MIIHIFYKDHLKDHRQTVDCFCEPHIIVLEEKVIKVIHKKTRPVIYKEWNKGSLNNHTTT